jgi:hypothetical protein
MSKRYVAVAMLLCLLAAGGWALAQQGRLQEPGLEDPRQKAAPGANLPVVPSIIPGQAGPATVPSAQGTPGRYAVVQVGVQGVLLDTATGKTWLLQAGSAGRAVWLPAVRLDSEKDVRKWQEEEPQRDRAHQREKAREEQRQALQAEIDQLRRLADPAQTDAARRLQALEQRLRELQKNQAPRK